MSPRVTLQELAGPYTIARLDVGDTIPTWADGEGFVSISRSNDELSIVCRAERVADDVKQDTGWTCYKFQGSFCLRRNGHRPLGHPPPVREWHRNIRGLDIRRRPPLVEDGRPRPRAQTACCRRPYVRLISMQKKSPVIDRAFSFA